MGLFINKDAEGCAQFSASLCLTRALQSQATYITISAVGFFFGDYTIWISRIGGVILIAFGLHLLGLLRIPRVERDYMKMKFGEKPVGHIGAFVIGMGFGAG